jgi:hypothetical protein
MESLKFPTIDLVSIGDLMGEEGKREYSLAILIILIILCWPGALIYYFTRPMVKTKPMRTCLGCGAQIPMEYAVCPHCGRKVS